MNAIDQADQQLFDHMRRNQAVSVGDIVQLLGVTATAVRQRLNRLMASGLVERELDRSEEGHASRGRPGYHYRLSEQGHRVAGDNYDDLVQAMWQEIRAIPDPEVRVGLLKRLAAKLAERYSDKLEGEDPAVRMKELMRLMGEHEVPLEVDESGELPVLTMLSCPYPTLAEQDRAICAMEKVMLSEVLGQGVKLSECRLDGDTCCSFSPSASSEPTSEAS